MIKLATSRLIIRNWIVSDAESFFELTQDEGFRLFPITNYQQSSVESARAWIEQAKIYYGRGLGKYAVVDKENGQMLGMGGLTPWQFENGELIDITYRFRRSVWGQGLGWELAQELVRYGFQDLGLSQITATITPDNIPSKKIASKLGMNFDQHITLLGVPTDLYRLYPSLK